MKIAGILLAAGAAKRFGSDKLLHPLADGTPIALASARKLAEALPGSVAVVRSTDTPLAMLLRGAGLEVVGCAEASQGMGHSLGAGVRARPDADGWVVALADMPYVRIETIREIAARLVAGAQIVAPMKDGQRGNPVGFSNAFRNELQSCVGDAGARALLKDQQHRITTLEVDDPGVLRDIDTPADLDVGQG